MAASNHFPNKITILDTFLDKHFKKIFLYYLMLICLLCLVSVSVIIVKLPQMVDLVLSLLVIAALWFFLRNERPVSIIAKQLKGKDTTTLKVTYKTKILGRYKSVAAQDECVRFTIETGDGEAQFIDVPFDNVGLEPEDLSILDQALKNMTEENLKKLMDQLQLRGKQSSLKKSSDVLFLNSNNFPKLMYLNLVFLIVLFFVVSSMPTIAKALLGIVATL